MPPRRTRRPQHRTAHAAILCLSSALWLAAGVASSSDFSSIQHGVAAVCSHYNSYDHNGDGRIEIEQLRRLREAGKFPYERHGRREGLVIILVEDRLLRPLSGAPNLRASLRQFVVDVAASGPHAILLAIREFFRSVKRLAPDFAGTVLVGNFPSALLVRQYFWRRRGPLTLNASRPNEARFSAPVAYWRSRAECLAMSGDVVLGDLDGRWEQCYHQAREQLPYLIAAFPDGTDAQVGVTTHVETGVDDFEDFFFINDGRWETAEVGTGRIKVKSLGERNNECSAAEVKLANPMVEQLRNVVRSGIPSHRSETAT